MAQKFEPRDNSGHLFKNNKKTKEEHPDFTGRGMVDGKKKSLSAWVKVIQSGENAGQKFISISFNEPWVPHRDEVPKREISKEIF